LYHLPFVVPANSLPLDQLSMMVFVVHTSYSIFCYCSILRIQSVIFRRPLSLMFSFYYFKSSAKSCRPTLFGTCTRVLLIDHSSLAITTIHLLGEITFFNNNFFLKLKLVSIFRWFFDWQKNMSRSIRPIV